VPELLAGHQLTVIPVLVAAGVYVIGSVLELPSIKLWGYHAVV
jgi:hypothetical protein